MWQILFRMRFYFGCFRYEDEHKRPHWPEHYRRDVERERHSASSRDHEPERDDERKYRRRREADRSKCCCPDRDLEFQGGILHPIVLLTSSFSLLFFYYFSTL